MSDVKHKEALTVTRQEAGDRLLAIAESLTEGTTLNLSIGGQQVSYQIPDSVTIELEADAEGDRGELEVKLKWREFPSNESRFA